MLGMTFGDPKRLQKGTGFAVPSRSLQSSAIRRKARGLRCLSPLFHQARGADRPPLPRSHDNIVAHGTLALVPAVAKSSKTFRHPSPPTLTALAESRPEAATLDDRC